MGDGPQPGTDGAAARVKHLGVPPRLLKSLLGDILRRRDIADYGHRYAEDEPLEAAHERERQLRIAGARPASSVSSGSWSVGVPTIRTHYIRVNA